MNVDRGRAIFFDWKFAIMLLRLCGRVWFRLTVGVDILSACMVCTVLSFVLCSVSFLRWGYTYGYKLSVYIHALAYFLATVFCFDIHIGGIHQKIVYPQGCSLYVFPLFSNRHDFGVCIAAGFYF
jgi:hypothetical protein